MNALPAVPLPDSLQAIISSQPEPEAREEAVNKVPIKRKRTAKPTPEIVMDTPLGKITIKKPRRPAGALIVALGQDEDHLRWYYDVYRRAYLKRAVSNLNAYQQGKKDRSAWSDSYFEFIQEAQMLLSQLPQECATALRQNREKIERREITVLGTYETLAQAKEAVRYSTKKREPTLSAGWLQVHVVEMPTLSGAGESKNQRCRIGRRAGQDALPFARE